MEEEKCIIQNIRQGEERGRKSIKGTQLKKKQRKGKEDGER